MDTDVSDKRTYRLAVSRPTHIFANSPHDVKNS